jgi:hypothetical protein
LLLTGFRWEFRRQHAVANNPHSSTTYFANRLSGLVIACGGDRQHERCRKLVNTAESGYLELQRIPRWVFEEHRPLLALLTFEPQMRLHRRQRIGKTSTYARINNRTDLNDELDAGGLELGG